MFTFRCTQKLIKRLSLPVISNPPNPTTQLGDWYGNVLFIRHHRLMMFVSDRSLLPVIMPIRERQNLLINFQKRLSTHLMQLGIEERFVFDELDQMDEYVIAPTASPSLDLELWLAETPCGAMDYRSPNQVAPELLALGSG